MEDTKTTISRRGLFRFGALTVLSAAAAPLIHLGHAEAQSSTVCNPGAPSTPAEALAALMAGNARWSTGDQTHPNEDSDRRTCLANNSQTPFASILSCSDSRCAPELVFDQGLGDIFVARVAGNTASGRLIDTLLFGTAGLGSVLLFVMGHTSCGAVINAVKIYPNASNQLPFLNLIFPAVKAARKIVKKQGGDPKDPTQVIPVATEQNVLITMSRLRKQLNLDPSAVAGGIYDLSTQVVTQVTPS
ncbi:MAG TPA: carbonic anhydrase [Candidatus Binataceae bacterium]|nr:carbonic anhydrase [Candidatus Binataceae bacterium]